MAEEPNQAEEAVEQTTTQTDSPTDTKQTDSTDVQAEETTQTKGETQEGSAQETKEQPEQKKGKRDRTAQGRIRELLQQNKELKQDHQQQVQQQYQDATPQQQAKFSDLVAGREDITPTELDQLANQYLSQNMQQVDSLVSLRMQQERANQNLEADIKSLEKNETLAGDSELEKEVIDMWQKAANARYDQNGKLISYNPEVRLADFAEKQLNIIESRANRGRAQDAAAASKQADEAAVTPSSRSKPEKTANEKTIAELRAEIGYHEGA